MYPSIHPITITTHPRPQPTHSPTYLCTLCLSVYESVNTVYLEELAAGVLDVSELKEVGGWQQALHVLLGHLNLIMIQVLPVRYHAALVTAIFIDLLTELQNTKM